MVAEWSVRETRRRGVRSREITVEGDVETAAGLCDWRIRHGPRGVWLLSKVT